jgi:tape measure domain-containing protein
MIQDIRWRVGLDGVSQVQQGGAQVEAAFQRMGQSTSAIDKAVGAVASIGTAFKAVAGLAIVNELRQVGAVAIQAADGVTVLQNNLKLATGSAAAASQSYSELYGVAQRSRVSFTELGGTYASIARATEGLGVSQLKLLTVTQAIGNAMAISGGNAAGMQAALTQLGQGLASGTLRGDELNSVLEQTPRLARAIAEGMGVTVGQLRELGQEGKITAEAVLNALQSQAETLAREVEGSVVTVSQAMTQVTNAATKAVGDLNQATGATSAISSAMTGLADTIDDVSDRLQRARAAGNGVFGSFAAAQVMAMAEALGHVDANAANVGRRLKDAEKELAVLQDRFAAQGGFYLAAKVEEARQLVEKLKEAKQAQDELKAERGTSMSSQMGEASGGIAAIAAKGLAEQKKLEEDLAEARNKALGVNDAWIKQLNVLAEARQKGLLSEREHLALAKQLTTATYQKAAATKKDADEMADAVKQFEELSKAGRDWSRGIAATNAALARELDLGRALTEGERQQLELTTKLASGQLVMNDAVERRARAEIDLGDALRKNVTWQRETASQNDAAFKRLQEETAAIEGRAAAMRKTNDQAFATPGALREIEQAEYAAAAAAKERLATVFDLVDPNIAAEYRRQAQAIRDTAAETSRAAGIEAGKKAREAAVESAREAERAWSQTADTIAGLLTDAIRSGGEEGWDRIKDYIESNAVHAIVQMAVNGVMGTGGGGAAGGAGGGWSNWLSMLMGNGGGGAGLFSSGNIATMAGTYLSAVYGNGASAYAAAIGASNYAAGSQAAMLAAQTGEFGAAGLSATSSAAAGAGAGTASTISAAIPIIGWIVAAYMASDAAYKGGATHDMIEGSARYATPGGSIAGTHYMAFRDLGMDEKWATILSGEALVARLLGHKQSVSGFGIGSVVGNAFAQEGRAPIEFGRNILQGGADEGLQALAAGVAQNIGATASMFGGGLTQGLRVGALTDRDREDKVAALLGFFRADNSFVAGTQTGSGSFGSGGPGGAASKIASADLEAWISEQMPVLMVQGLQQSDLDARFETYFNSVGAAKLTPELASTMLQTASAVQQFTQVFTPLGGAFSQLEDLSVATVERLAKAAGGFDALGQQASEYYQGFYSEAERTEQAWAGVNTALQEAGVKALPKTKEEFRALVDSLGDLSTEADQKAFVALMRVSGAFAQLTDAADAAAQKLAEEAAARAKALDSTITENLPKFLKPEEQRVFKYQQVQGDLQRAGVSIGLEQLMGASKADVLAFARSFINLADGASEAEIAVAGAAGALADLADDAATAAAAQRATAAEKEAEEVARVQALTAAFDGMVANLKQGVAAAYSDVAQIISAERQRAETEAEKSLRTLEQQADRVEQRYSGLIDSLGSSLEQLTSDLAGDGGRAKALRTLQQARDDLAGGRAVDTDAVRAAAGTAARVDQANYASALEYRRALASTAGLIRDVTAAARQQQSSELGAIAAQQVKIEADLQKQLDSLDAQLDQARAAAGSLVSIDDGIKTVGGALDRLAQAMGAVNAVQGSPDAPTGQWVPSGGAEVWASSGGAVAVRETGATVDGSVIRGKTGNKFTIAEAQAWVTERLAAGDVMGIYARAIAEGIDSSSLDALMGWPLGTSLAEAKRLGLPAFEVGTNFVPNTGLALVHEGERIIPAADNAALMRMLSDGVGRDDGLLAEMRAMREELEALRRQSMNNDAIVAGNTGKAARLLDDVINGGASVRTEVAA